MRSSRSAYEEAEMAERRREAGAWLRKLRDARGFTQRQLAERVGLEYYTFVSQIEAGRGRIPADRYLKWADALEIDPKIFVKNILHFYEPTTYQILFGDENAQGLNIVDASTSISSGGNVLALRPPLG
jgi:transcriptional regulator with XRE-family HTH domain